MGNPWFRFYNEAVDDEKLRLLAFEDRWHFVAILCLKNSGVLDAGDDDALMRRKVAVKLGVQLRELDEVERRLQEVGLIGDGFQPVAWEARQFHSDSSAERTRKYRERMKRHCDVTVTPQETETDTDTEEIRPVVISCSSQGSKPDVVLDVGGCGGKETARSGQKIDALTRSTPMAIDFYLPPEWDEWARTNFRGCDPPSLFSEFKDHWIGNGKTHKNWFAVWRNWVRRAKRYSRNERNCGRIIDWHDPHW